MDSLIAQQPTQHMTLLQDLETPALIVDRLRLDHNLALMRRHVTALGPAIRPHVKTVKSIEVVRRALAGRPEGITVSTLREADHFFQCGIRDIVYAVGIAPSKLRHASDLIRRGADLTLLLDNAAVVAGIDRVAQDAGVRIPVLIEVDVDAHRAGIAPDAPQLLEVAQAIAGSRNVDLRGVFTHAGGSYDCHGDAELREFAERERAGAVRAAQRLRETGFAAPVVSVGSTPTITFARHLEGVTEVRVGVYMFQDLVMAGLGVCSVDDIALSVLVSVIGHQPDKGWVITDGGWMSLSRDHGTAGHRVDQGYGLVRDVAGRAPSRELIVQATNQEHGIVVRRDGGRLTPQDYPVGTLLRILPNHACATAAQHDTYYVVEGEHEKIIATWQRFNGW